MDSTRWLRLVGSVMVVGLALACGGGGDAPQPEESAASEPAPEPEAAAEAEVEEESAEDIPTAPGPANPIVEMRTSAGSIVLELYPEQAPKTVDNFLTYVRDGFYDGTIFHRVVPNFVIQGGGFTADMTKKETAPPIENEADNGLRNLRGSICMARTPDPHSATSQFFINTKDNPPLDFRGKTPQGWGYAVFGKVTEGLSVVDEIEKTPRTSRDGYQDVPVDPIVIESVRIVG